MNIFALDEDPKAAAQMACDKHVVKMPTESCQLLATCFPLERLAEPDVPRTQKGNVRKHFNPKHPSSIWARATTGNLLWLCDYLHCLFEEKYFRYPDGGRMFNHDFFDWAIKNLHDTVNTAGKLQKFSLAINADCECRKQPEFDEFDPVNCYRLYYIHDKPFAEWNKTRPKPNWMK